MDTISKKFRGIAGLLGLTDGDAAEEANDASHATSPELPAELPWLSPSDSPRQYTTKTTSVDSTHGIYQNDSLPNLTRPRLERLPHNSKRRTSEATPAPDPALGFCVAMVKPGKGMGIQPINTLKGHAIADRVNPARKQTYGKIYRNAAKLPSRELLSGREEDHRQHPQHTTAGSPGYVRGGPSSAKRRKTEKPNAAPIHTVEITDDEDDVAPHAHSTSTPRARSTISSGSPHSTFSKHSGTEIKSTSQPTSEFTNTERMFDARRNTKPRPRRPRSKGSSERRKESPANSPFFDIRSPPQTQPLTIYDDSMDSSRSARSLILQNHEQGVDHDPPPNKPQRSTGAKSRYFESVVSKMRINESTRAEVTAAEHDNIAGSSARQPGSSRNLREFRSAEHPSAIQDDPIESSGDELAQTTPNTSRPRQRQTPSKAGQKRGSGRQHNDAAGKCYRLKYARSYHLNVNSENLQLRQDKRSPKRFRITSFDREGNFETLETLDLGRVVRSNFDNINRIRLTGSSANGNLYWFDLHFADPLEFKDFRNTHVIPECLSPKNKVNKSEIMMDLFNKPLQWNDKVGKSPMVSEESFAASAHDRPQAVFKSTTLDALKNSARDIDREVTSTRDRVRQPPGATQAPLRPARTTRATAPLHDREVIEEKEVEKYSEVHGLGKPWSKPLDYSVDSGFLKRRKATLNFDDLLKLDEGEFLNDSIMTFYMLYLYDEMKVSIDRVYFFNTYFFPTLTRKVRGRDGINYDDVKSWTKRDDVFSYDYIVVPINENLHWYLAIICNVSNINRIPAVEELRNDSQDLDQMGLDESRVPPGSSNGISAEAKGNIGGILSAPEDTAVTYSIDHDGVNLFEEEKKLNLVNRDAEIANEEKQHVDRQDGPDEKVIQDETVTASSHTQADGASTAVLPDQAKQALRKKGRSKPGPQKKDPEKPVIMILDSLCGTHSNATRALRGWLQAEGLEKRAMTVEIENKGHYPKASQIPTQTNFSDCGLYVLGYLRKFFADPDQFKIKLLQQQMSAESDWPGMNPSKMRDDIRQLIFRLNDARNGARKEAHKAKQAASATDDQASPAKSDPQEVNPAVQQPYLDKSESSTVTPVAAEAEQAAGVSVTKGSTPPIAVSPRLGSPFKPDAKSGKTPTAITAGAQKRDTNHTSSTLNTSTETSPVRRKQSPSKRTKSPEVRVPVSSPHIDLSSYVPYDGASDPPERSTQQPVDLVSPLRNRDPRSKDDEELRILPAKKAHANSPSRSSRNHLGAFASLQTRTRSGSHDDPITLDDSQDLDAPFRKQPPPETIELDRSEEFVQAPAPRIERQARGSPMGHRGAPQHFLSRDDSIQEVVGHDWQERYDITLALQLSLADEADRFRQRSKPDERMEDVFDAQAAYSQSSHTVQGVPDTQEAQEAQEAQKAQPMEVNDDGDDDDRVVPESPEQRRSSPGPDVEMVG